MGTDLILIAILVILLGSAILYMKKEKKRGVTCIGCPDAEICAKRRNGGACKSVDTK